VKAPKIGQQTAMIGGIEMPVRPHLGVFTQPFSFIGLPAVTVPVWLPNEALPMGVQIVCAPWREDIALRIAHQLEQAGAVAAPVAKAFDD
jgi:aspartyl-tRNA(Asn)/glutamyl-tRNA(Gln) amidotransferase subunit A